MHQKVATRNPKSLIIKRKIIDSHCCHHGRAGRHLAEAAEQAGGHLGTEVSLLATGSRGTPHALPEAVRGNRDRPTGQDKIPGVSAQWLRHD